MEALVADRRTRAAGVAALLLIQICVGYEWLVSGLTKVVRGGFVNGLAGQLRSMHDGPGWYRSFLAHDVIPHAHLLAYLIEIAEVAVGATLLGAAVILLARGSRLPAGLVRALLLAGVAASLAGLVMVVNFALADGSTFGLTLASDGFDEGVDLDTLLIGLQLALLAFGLVGAAARRPSSSARNSCGPSVGDIAWRDSSRQPTNVVGKT